MTDEMLVDEVAEEIEAAERDRARLIEARDAHPELDHWKHDYQVDAIGRHLARLRELA